MTRVDGLLPPFRPPIEKTALIPLDYYPDCVDSRHLTPRLTPPSTSRLCPVM
jgi:hypothetical protein